MPNKLINRRLLFNGPRRYLNYMNSVQYGVITIAASATSGTATIDAVGSLAWVQIIGQNNNASADELSKVVARIDLTNSTTVTANRFTAASNTVTVWFCVMDANSNLVESIQQGTVARAASTSGTATISAVDLTRSVVIWNGCSGNATIAPSGTRMSAVDLTNTTTVTARSTSSATDTTNFVVVQFQAAVINRLTEYEPSIIDSSLTHNTTVSPSAVMANTTIFYGGTATNGQSFYTIVQSSTTNILKTRTSTSTTGRTPKFTLVEFKPGVIKSSQRGTISLISLTSNTATIAPVNKSRSLLNWSYNALGSDVVGALYVGGTLTNGTTVTANVNTNTANTKTLGFSVIEFN